MLANIRRHIICIQFCLLVLSLPFLWLCDVVDKVMPSSWPAESRMRIMITVCIAAVLYSSLLSCLLLAIFGMDYYFLRLLLGSFIPNPAVSQAAGSTLRQLHVVGSQLFRAGVCLLECSGHMARAVANMTQLIFLHPVMAAICGSLYCVIFYFLEMQCTQSTFWLRSGEGAETPEA